MKIFGFRCLPSGSIGLSLARWRQKRKNKKDGAEKDKQMTAQFTKSIRKQKIRAPLEERGPYVSTIFKESWHRVRMMIV